MATISAGAATGDSAGDRADSRPCLVIVANTLTPYRINLHRLLAAEIPELQLLTLVTHGAADFQWQHEAPAEIHVTNFARRGEPAHGGMLVAPWADWKKGGTISQFLSTRHIAAVIFSGYGYPSHLRLIRYLARRGTPFFLRNDVNICIERLRSPWRRWIKGRFFHWAARHARGVMPMGTFGAAYFASYGFPAEKMYYVPYTPDYDWYAQRDESAVIALRARFGLDAARRRLLYSGRLHPVKRVDLLLDAFARIAVTRPKWDLMIVGSGPLEKELRTRLPAELRSRVTWTGFLEAGELRAAYHACDALVLPSMREAWGVVVQEALAAGRPVVASDVVGAARDLVEDGVNGRIFRCDDLNDLTAALEDVTDDRCIARYQAAASARLAAWRREVDVVSEVRRALRDAAALPSGSPS
jgi:glycosyltransferase involved in cell wall biosynthesis